MKDKTKIIMIYSGVAALSVILLVFFNFLGEQRKLAASESVKSKRQKASIEQVVKPLTLYGKQIGRDLKGLNQDGESVSLFDLKGKVVVFAQFYSRCNMCLGYNKIIMQELHEELKDNPNVHFVTVTLDPEFDTPQKLKESAEVWNAETKSWWMLNVPKDELTDFCREELWYIDYKDNAKKTSASDAITHDMGIAVIDTESKLQAKVNLFELLSKDKNDLYQLKKSQLLEVIELSLKGANHNE
ncbi:MAG: cytochrome oxidase Cu insertion factor (SCO1/SenC/PrrC family) [Crocinitomicaceae bacterium]|jgi:cytochrome oxidase Cu insertion factor (SCO1/SenC/PrrC family)